MNGRSTTERILDAYLAPEADRLPDRVIDAALADIARTPQRRALGVPWRFPQMTSSVRAAAGIAIVAIVGVGVLAFNLRSQGSGSQPPGPSAATANPTSAPTLPPGIPGWTSYTSPIYGFTMAYPSHWSLDEPATLAWPAGRDVEEATPYMDVFANRDEEILFGVWEIPTPAGVSLRSTEGLSAALPALCETIGAASCEPAFPPSQKCLGPSCWPAIVTLIGDVGGEIPYAFVGDPVSNAVIVFVMGREDTFPAAAKYGGTVALLNAIIDQVDVTP